MTLKTFARALPLGCLALTGALLSCAGPGSLARMGSELLAEGKYEAALEVYDKALQSDSSDPILMGRAASAMHLGRYDIAIRDYSAVIARKGTQSTAALLGRGQAYASIKSTENAIKDYDAALGARGASIDIAHAYYLRALAYQTLGRYDPAFADCQRAIDADPSRPQACELRGDLFAALGNAQAASENYVRAKERYSATRQDADVARVRAKMLGKPVATQPTAAAAQKPAPGVTYQVEAADPRMRVVGEYLLLKPISQLAEVMLKIVLGEIPDYQQGALRNAAAQVDLKKLQDQHADIMRTQLSMMELEGLVRMIRLERSTAPADAAELQSLKYSDYGSQIQAREQVAFNELLKAYRSQLRGACVALGLGC